jgi:hypothetical protein
VAGSSTEEIDAPPLAGSGWVLSFITVICSPTVSTIFGLANHSKNFTPYDGSPNTPLSLIALLFPKTKPTIGPIDPQQPVAPLAYSVSGAHLYETELLASTLPVCDVGRRIPIRENERNP